MTELERAAVRRAESMHAKTAEDDDVNPIRQLFGFTF
jgi:hypothetical protein